MGSSPSLGTNSLISYSKAASVGGRFRYFAGLNYRSKRFEAEVFDIGEALQIELK